MNGYLIVGGGRGGTALLKTLSRMHKKIYAIIDHHEDSPGIKEAKKLGIPWDTQYHTYLSEKIEVIIEATGKDEVYADLLNKKRPDTVLIPGTTAQLIHDLIEERQALIEQLSRQKQEIETIVNSTHDGMIAINRQGKITLFNRAAEIIMGKKVEEVIHTSVQSTIPNSRLHIILESAVSELNQEQDLENGKRIITNRVPIRDGNNQVIGAVAVFRDITEVAGLTRKITDLRDIKSLFEAIISSSNDAISVVDEHGMGIMINPAYTRLTGLSPEQVISKPASVDISEGESMHMHVLQTEKPVRGVPLKVGPKKKDVLVNVAPIFIEDKLKGSVAIIHDTSEIKKLTSDLEKAKRIIRSLEAKYTFQDIVGESNKMKLVIEQAKQAASTSATVLLRGESGTGKEMFAHAIHNDSSRKFSQFIRVNCAALSENLLESELFGYVEGAFTGAQRGGKRGLFEEASGGTIFLDEIGEMSLNTQAKLLRVLQEREIVRVGGTKSIPVDVRVIAATNVDLERAIEMKKFREDLYYRLNVLPIMIPPLRERRQDIRVLAMHLLKKINSEYGRNVEVIDERALHILENYSWPGNVRELENIIGRSLIYMELSDKTIYPEHLTTLGGPNDTKSEIPPQKHVQNLSLDEIIREVERNYIKEMLNTCDGNRTETAKKLGISLRNLYYKLEKYNIE